jgi:sulfite reductase (ferredoxin)
MTPTSTAAAEQAVPRKASAKRRRSEGQWALGHREPLNGNEQQKKDDDALHVRERILSVYSQRGFDSIDPADLRGRFRWMGLYTQRRPGIDGGRTGSLEPEEIEDSHFMMRIRLDGGRLTSEQLRTIGEISQTFARDSADISDRSNVQLHWVRIEDVPEIWQRLESVRLHSTEACGDCPRAIIASPVAGVDAEEIVDGTPAVQAIRERYIGDPAFSNLPRKYKTSISGSPNWDAEPEINDVSFVGVVHPEHGPGFDLWVGGGLSTNPKLAQRLGVWVPLDEVPEVWVGVTSIFRDYGYRRSRNKARLKFLLADWGTERFREVLEKEYLHRALADGPAPPAPAGARDHIGVHAQADGNYFVCAKPMVGRVSGTTLVGAAKAAERVGSQRLRTTVHQNLIVLDVPEAEVSGLRDELDGLGLATDPSPWRRGMLACTGIEFCKLAIVETKEKGASLIEELETRLADVNDQIEMPISVTINGCPNACARTQVADIGLKGQIITNDEGEQVPGYQVHLGGGLAADSGLGRKVRGLKVAEDEIADYVERVSRRYLAQRSDGERFVQWAARAEESELA